MTTKGRLRHRREAAKGRNGGGLQREEETERTEGGNSTTLEDEGQARDISRRGDGLDTEGGVQLQMRARAMTVRELGYGEGSCSMYHGLHLNTQDAGNESWAAPGGLDPVTRYSYLRSLATTVSHLLPRQARRSSHHPSTWGCVARTSRGPMMVFFPVLLPLLSPFFSALNDRQHRPGPSLVEFATPLWAVLRML